MPLRVRRTVELIRNHGSCRDWRMATRAGHSARRYVPVSRHYPDLLARGPPPVQMAPLRVVRRRNIALGNCEACLRTRARDGINIIEGWSYAGRQGPAAAVVGNGEPGIVDRRA